VQHVQSAGDRQRPAGRVLRVHVHGHRDRSAQVPTLRDRHRHQQSGPVRHARRLRHAGLRRPGGRRGNARRAPGKPPCCR
jgi:hypothetical protein